MDIIKKDKTDLLVVSRNLPDLPRPFEREIYLFSTYIAGTGYIENIEELIEGMDISEDLEFYREPKNTHDNLAISVKTKKKEKLGYLPRADNLIFARLMDAGKLLFGKVKEIKKRGNWFKIEIDIYLKD